MVDTCPFVSIVVTCKGRLDHLKETYSSMIHSGFENIIVDYDCPQNTNEWVQSETTARAVRVSNRPYFNASEARNIGATFATGQYIAFVDADTFLSANFFSQLEENLTLDTFISLINRKPGQGGLIVCPRRVFFKIGGYDEILSNYGVEDDDLYIRLAARLRPIHLDAKLISLINHDDEIRTKFFKIINRNFGIIQNQLYIWLRNLTNQNNIQGQSLDYRKSIYVISGLIVKFFGIYLIQKFLNFKHTYFPDELIRPE